MQQMLPSLPPPVLEASLKSWSQVEVDLLLGLMLKAKWQNNGVASSAQFDVKTVVDNVAKKVSITVDMDQYNYFLLGYFRKNPQIRVTASAKLSSETPVCMIALDPAKPRAVNIVDQADLLADNCAAFSNSIAKDGALRWFKGICEIGLHLQRGRVWLWRIGLFTDTDHGLPAVAGPACKTPAAYCRKL